MTHGPGSSEDSAVDGKFSRIAFSGTIDRNHTVRPFADVTNRRARSFDCATTVATPLSIRAHLCASSPR